jgi:hypothetical protein
MQSPRSGRSLIAAPLEKPTRLAILTRLPEFRAALIIAVTFVPSLARIRLAADANPAVFPPLQIFKEFCTDGSWSLDDPLQLAEQHHFALVTPEDVPMPDGIKAHMIMLQAETAVGPTVLAIIAGENKANLYRLTCKVSAPADSADFMRSWLRQSLGDPTSTLKKPQNATEIHSAQTFDGGTVEVALNARVPDEKHATLSIMKQIAITKGAKQN